MAGGKRHELDAAHDEQGLVSYDERIGPLLALRKSGKGGVDFGTIAGAYYFERYPDS